MNSSTEAVMVNFHLTLYAILFVASIGFVARRFEHTPCVFFCYRLRRESIALRHAQLRHPIQRRHFEKQFCGLLREGPGVQRRPKEGLETEEGGLRQTPSMVARLLFPPASALVPDRPQVLIPLPGRTGAVAMLPNLGVPPRRDHGLGPALSQGVVTVPL